MSAGARKPANLSLDNGLILAAKELKINLARRRRRAESGGVRGAGGTVESGKR